MESRNNNAQPVGMNGVWRRLSAAVIAVMAMSATSFAIAADRAHTITDVTVIPLKRGVNNVEKFSDDGRAAVIIDAWRENMNAHGYTDYIVMLPRPDQGNELELVTFDGFEDWQHKLSQVDRLQDEPFDDENVVASVRFAKARFDGVPATLAITAVRDTTHMQSFVDKLPVRISIYRLKQNADEIPGWPYDYFDRVESFTAKKRYCNSDLALTRELSLPLPADYQGANELDGCDHQKQK